MRAYDKIVAKIEKEIKKNLLYESDFWPMTEEKLAERFGVSRMPVRVVISRLEQENLVVRRNKTGTKPRVPCLKEMIQIFDIRALLEPEITAVATGKIKNPDIDEIRKNAVLCEKYTTTGNSKFGARYDVAFHRKIAEISGNKYALSILESLSILTRTFIAFSPEHKTEGEFNPNSHRKIIEAMAGGNIKKAKKAMYSHLNWSRIKMRKIIER